MFALQGLNLKPEKNRLLVGQSSDQGSGVNERIASVLVPWLVSSLQV